MLWSVTAQGKGENSTRRRIGSMRSARTRMRSPSFQTCSSRSDRVSPGRRVRIWISVSRHGNRYGAAATAANDRVIALAVKNLFAGQLLDSRDGHDALDEDLHQLDEESEFLHRNDQRVVLLAQMLLHELRRLPGHQFALGGFGAALGLGSFLGDGLEFAAAVGPNVAESSFFSPTGPGEATGRASG